MKDLIYYPTFEPSNLNWLKYAIAYVEEFSPIIPVSGKKKISDTFKKIEQETSLIRSIEPKWHHGDNATNKAIERIEKIKKNPNLYKSIFNNENILEAWTNPINWNESLYKEKYNDFFINFCIGENFGKENKDGLYVSEELAGFYMTFLAEEIAFDKQASPITDLPHLDGLSTFLRTKDFKQEGVMNAATAIIDLYLPDNIESIEIDDFLKFRNDTGITELRNSFNITTEAFYNSVEENFDPYTYLESLDKINKNLLIETGKFFGSAGAFVLNCTMVTNMPITTEIIAKILEGGVAIASIDGIGNEWELSKDRRKARKFLSKVRKIGG